MNIVRFLYGGLSRSRQECQSPIYPLKLRAGSGSEADLSEYAGKVILIVNTASRCGFTKQYDALEKLYQLHAARGFVVLGFPSNDFGQQEPGSDSDIGEFCRVRHGVSFPLFAKGSVRGAEKQPLFQILTEKGPPDLRGEILWNFEKFLVDRRGMLVGRWRSYVSPLSHGLQHAIERELAA